MKNYNTKDKTKKYIVYNVRKIDQNRKIFEKHICYSLLMSVSDYVYDVCKTLTTQSATWRTGITFVQVSPELHLFCVRPGLEIQPKHIARFVIKLTARRVDFHTSNRICDYTICRFDKRLLITTAISLIPIIIIVPSPFHISSLPAMNALIWFGV